MAAGGASPSSINDGLMASMLRKFYDPELSSTFLDYNKALECLTCLCYTDQDFNYVLNGDGFGELPATLKYLIEDGVFCIKRESPQQTVYHIHRHALVLNDIGVEYKEKRPLLYYMTRQEHPGRLKLWMSGRTYTQMLRGLYGLEFDDRSAHVLKDSFNLPKFYLSAARYEECFKEISSNFLCTYKQVICKFSLQTGLEMHPPQYPDDLEGKYVGRGDGGHGVYGLKSMPALWCPEWPEAASDWLMRSRPSGWPNRGLVQLAQKEGCLLVPDSKVTPEELEEWCEMQNEKKRFRQTEEDDEDETTFLQGRECDWTYAFVQAERVLVRSFNPLQRNVMEVIHALLHNLDDFRKAFDVMHINHCLLWIFEEQAADSSDPLAVLKFVKLFLDRFCDYLRRGEMPHYFIEDWNLLHEVSEERVLDTEEILDEMKQNLKAALVASKYTPLHCLSQVMTSSGTDLCDMLKSRLLQSYKTSLFNEFQENTQFLVLAGYVKMHKYSFEEAIVVNRDIKRAIQRDNLDPAPYVGVYLSVLESHLGMLFQAKAQSSILKRQKLYLFEEAESSLKSSKTGDGSLCRLRLANLLYCQGKYHEALQELNQVFANVHSDPWYYADLPDDDDKLVEKGDDSVYYKQLWYRWNRSVVCHDMMLAKCVRGTLPSEMDKSASLSMCQVLGNAENSAAIYSASFAANVLATLCHIQLREPSLAKGILQRLERDSSCEGQKDLNEKRTAAYLLILGNCYTTMKQENEAGHAYNLSLMTFPSPRNPARLSMMGMSFNRIWAQVMKGLKLVAVTALASYALGYIQAQL